MPGMAVGVPGVPGATFAVGTIPLEAMLAPEVPAPFVAVAENVYSTPGVNPATTHDVAGAVTVQLPPMGEDVTA